MFRRDHDRLPIGDVIPVYDTEEDVYHLFYLAPSTTSDDLVDRLSGVHWAHLSSTDLVHWEVHGPALAPTPGTIDADGILTGSVLKAGGSWHAFYAVAVPGEAPAQVICHATSEDLCVFNKDATNPILVPTDGFESGDWRDPFVWWDERVNQFRMILSARRTDGPAALRGVIASATSPDLCHWTVDAAPFLDPMNTDVPECPDLWRLGGRWLLSYSAYTGRPGLHHFAADSSSGPWSPVESTTDGGTWYAARSLRDRLGRTLSFGWIAERADHDDDGRFVWGGDLALPRELVFSGDGVVGHRLPAEVDAVLRRSTSPSTVVRASAGWSPVDGGAWQSASDVAYAQLGLDVDERRFRLSFELTMERGLMVAGVQIGVGPDVDRGLSLVLDAGQRTVELFQVSRRWTHLTDSPFGPWVRHHCVLGMSPTVSVDVIVDGSIVETFVDGRISSSGRLYADPRDGLSVFSRYTEVRVQHLRVSLFEG